MVIAIWIAALIGATAIHSAVGSNYVDNFTLRGTESQRANALLAEDAPASSGDTDQLVMEVSRGTVDSPAAKQQMSALLAKVARLDHVTHIASPYATDGQISQNRRIAFATVTFDMAANVFPGIEAADYDHLIQTSGNATVRFAADGQVAEDGNPGGGSGGIAIGSLAAGVVLFLVFGSLLATALPLLTAGLSLGTGLAVVGILSHVMNMASFSGELALLIGMGVGVDYALFIVTRYRQGRLRGLPHEEAVVESIDTTGRAVMFAGMIVCVAMLGMFLLGISFLYGVAVASAVVVAFTVLSALTLLPALLSLFGDRTLRRSERKALATGRHRRSDESRGWARWSSILTRRPAILAIIATGLMLLLSVPFLSMRLGSADYSSDAKSTTTYQAYNMLAAGFGAGYNGPLELVATVANATERQQFTALTHTVARTPDVDHVAPPTFLRGHDGRPSVAIASVYERDSPQAASTSALLSTLRNQTLPAATATNNLTVLVTGQTAVFADFAAALTAKLPLFIGIVVLVSALLLMMVFRSVLIPLTAAVMNLLSTAASLGIVTAIFQFGWAGSLLGLQRGPIEAFLPVMMFPILFGLSMDYEVFLVSRIHEEWHRRGCTTQAVSHGLASTGRTITAAAAIMVLVFAAFILGGQRIIDMFGIGLASAVLLDALIIRAVVVPAAMLMLGEHNWRLPALLERHLPRLNVEGSTLAEPVPVPEPS